VADLRAFVEGWCQEHLRAESLAAAEAQADQVAQLVGAAVLTAGVLSCGTRAGYTGPQRPCGCGARARFVGYRRRWVRSRWGEVGVERAYYHCAACHQGEAPWDREQGLDQSVLTPRLKAWLADGCARLPYREVAALLERGWGLCVAESTLEATTLAVGQRLRAAEEDQVQALFERNQLPRAAPSLARVVGGRFYVSMDAAKAHTDGAWHDIKVGACYRGERTVGDLHAERADADEPSADRPADTQVLARQEEAGAFGRRLYTQALRLGVERAAQVVVVGDGAEWIWNVADTQFSDSVQILDFFHACERVWEVARLLYADADGKGERWAEERCRKLAREGPVGLLHSLRQHESRAAARPEVQEGLRRARGYFETHRPRMQYPRYRAAGMMIGSGPVEAACKTVVGQRLKGSGMRWSGEGADAMLAVRTAVLNGEYDRIAAYARAS
jgi:hypothetical protein